MDHIERAKTLLREHFGYTGFYAGQEAIIRNILEGRDVLGIMPTGGGKSLCYQIPALMLPGITVVISPLISLMKDQVDTLQRLGIAARLLNSALSPREAGETYRALHRQEIKLLYIAPERLEAEGFMDILAGLPIAMVAVDEAHCVSQWGHDFRPSYRQIRAMIAGLPVRPRVSAFTATATENVKEDILALLGLDSPYVLCTGFDRANLHFAVYAPPDRERFILDYIRARPGVAGIVYCLTRKNVDKLSHFLTGAGLSVLPYHAGLDDETRRRNQDAFRHDRIDVMVATNAFGMGIDKSNVRYVLHAGMPKTLESYYQEAGRAGRDGEEAACILLYAAQDIMTNRILLESSGEDSDKTDDYKKLQQMVNYCHIDTCLRAYILRYFGMTDAAPACANCSNCSDGGEAARTDITVEAQKIISCVIRMGNRFGNALVAQVLRGADTKRIRDLRLNKLSTYGIMKEYPEKTIKEIMAYLTAHGYLLLSAGEYPVLMVGQKGREFLRQKSPLTMKRMLPKQEKAQKRHERESKPAAAQRELFEKLRTLRKAIAEELQVPPFVVFSDATLKAMCSLLPCSSEEMLTVPGVGKYKLEQYGDAFLDAVREFVDGQGIKREIGQGGLGIDAGPRRPVTSARRAGPAQAGTKKQEDTVTKSKSKDGLPTLAASAPAADLPLMADAPLPGELPQLMDSPQVKDSHLSAGNTVLHSFLLYHQGKSVAEIAAERDLAKTTVEKHLVEAYRLGLAVNPEDFIPEEHREVLLAAIAKHGDEFLKPIKEAVPREITYTAIRFAVEMYKKISEKGSAKTAADKL